MSEPTIPSNLHDKPVTDVVDDVMRQGQEAMIRSREALESGARATAELNELRRRAEEALDWRTQMNRHPYVAMGVAIFAAAFLYQIFAPRRCNCD